LILIISFTSFEIRSGDDDGTTTSSDYIIVDTGQDKCYDNSREITPPQADQSFFGQDARYDGVQPAYLDNGDGTITDLATGLMWQQADDGNAYDWEAALDYAENLELAGHEDWRLPNAKELQSIVDYTRSPSTTGSAAIDPVFNATSITNEAGNTDYPFYWTGTTHVSMLSGEEGRSAAYVAFGRAMGYMNGQWIDVHGAGAQRSDPKTGDPNDYPYGHGPQGDAIRIYNYVRCVRDAEVDTGVEDLNLDSKAVPSQFTLEQNYPNPFNPTTHIPFQLLNSNEVEMTIYNLRGEKVKTLVSGMREAGSHEVVWDGTDDKGQEVGSGIYLCKMVMGVSVSIMKMSVMK